MKTIELSKQGKNKGKKSLVDNEDFERLNEWRWYYSTGYAKRRISGTTNFFWMHREIMECPKNLEVDHINGNGLDNRKENLRLVTTLQNTSNHTKQKNNKSGFRGVSWDKRRNKWRTVIMVNYKYIHLGYFQTKEQGAEVWNEAAKKYFGNYAKLNQINVGR